MTTTNPAHLPTMTTNDLPVGSDAYIGSLLCADYHGGQNTAMYAVASAGALELYPGAGIDRLQRELADAIDIAENQGAWRDAYALLALSIWLEDDPA